MLLVSDAVRFRLFKSLKSFLGPVAGFALAVALAAFLSTGAVAEPTTTGHLLMMSDLHFDPMADRSLVDRLAAAEPAEWSAVLEGSEDKNLGSYGRDANWMLLRSALLQAREVIPLCS